MDRQSALVEIGQTRAFQYDAYFERRKIGQEANRMEQIKAKPKPIVILIKLSSFSSSSSSANVEREKIQPLATRDCLWLERTSASAFHRPAQFTPIDGDARIQMKTIPGDIPQMTGHFLDARLYRDDSRRNSRNKNFKLKAFLSRAIKPLLKKSSSAISFNETRLLVD